MSSEKTKKFVFFWLPYDVKYIREAFFPALHLAIARFPKDDTIHIGKKDTFEPTSISWLADWLKKHNAEIATADILQNLDKRLIEQSVFQILEDQYLSCNLVWKHLLTERFQPLEDVFEKIICELKEQYEIEAIVMWFNNPSVSYIANKYGIDIIHNEVGPLRQPYYVDTAYFDMKGVNGGTELRERFLRAKSNGYDKQLSRKDILNIVGDEKYLIEIFRSHNNERELGIPLQVEDDSNLIAFSNGFDNLELIKLGKSISKSLIVRKHPLGQVEYIEVSEDYKNISPIEFIKLCNKIITINSSVSFESVLYGKECQILGDSPFKILSDYFETHQSDKDIMLAVNFIIFNYLIPFDFLFNIDYYRWRLSKPTEEEIFNFHFQYYLSINKLNSHQFNNSDKLFESVFLNRVVHTFSNENLLLKSEIEQLKAQYYAMNNELNLIKNSKYWRYSRKIKKFLSIMKNSTE